MKIHCQILTILLFSVFFSASAKDKRLIDFINNQSYFLNIKNFGIGMPPHFVNGRAHLGVEIGTQHLFISKKKSSFLYQYSLGYFSQQSLQRALFLRPGIGYQGYFFKQFYIKPQLHVAAMWVRQINEEFVFQSNGEFKKISSSRIQWMPSLGAELGLPLFQHKNRIYHARAGYDFGVQLPFSALSKILPINQIYIGISSSISSK